MNTLRLGTRGSLLARRQSEIVADAIRARHPHVQIQTIAMQTSGDRIKDRPLYDEGGKGLFTKEIEQALIDGEIDVAVHSYKDLPVTMPLVDASKLVIAAALRREDVRDVLIARSSMTIQQLPARARVGTSSLRRRCQTLDIRADLELVAIRGNIDTRVRKLRSGEFDAIILAMAGLVRANMFDPATMRPIDLDQMLPAPGQGALAIQCRRDDSPTVELLGALDDPATRACVAIERQVVARLGGDCHSPIAALAEIDGARQQLRLRVAVGERGGELPIVRAEAIGDAHEPAKMMDELFARPDLKEMQKRGRGRAHDRLERGV